jgi:hypothetical protein
MPTNKKELIELDFVEHDTIALLEMLIQFCKENSVAGMVYAVRLKHGRSSHAYFGATGRLADDSIEAAGVASMLSHKFSREAVEKYS